MSRAVFVLPLMAGGLAWLTAASPPVRPPAEIVFNENLQPAGRLSRGVLTVSPGGGRLFGRRVLRVVQEP